jgi:hypothetical protein
MHYEFKLDLKPVWHKEPQKKPLKEPPIRKTLVLAYQIDEYIKQNNIVSLKEFCKYANITNARATQITRLLLLPPLIQEDILLGDEEYLQHISERNIRSISKQIVWKEQENLWNEIRR